MVKLGLSGMRWLPLSIGQSTAQSYLLRLRDSKKMTANYAVVRGEIKHAQ